MTANIEIEGLDRALKKLGAVQGLKVVRAALKAGATHVKGKIAKYPAAGSGNQPGGPGSSWYERGYGTKYLRKTDGGITGRQTSETLGRKWTITAKRAGLTQVVGNNVSYGPYVQDADEQAEWHKGKWKTTQDAAEEEAGKVRESVKKRIDQALEEG